MKAMAALSSLVIIGLCCQSVRAADAMKPTMPGVGAAARPFEQTDGAQLYEAICQACHMREGAGATGAAAYPALAKNARLAAKSYAVALILNGSKAMPSFKSVLSDGQIAALVDYIRTHFGNRYHDKVSAIEVEALRK